MALVLDRNHVLDVYAEARERKWVLPCFNAENLVTIEAILEAVKKYGMNIEKNDLPIIIGITNNYSHRPQSIYFTNTREWEIGLRLFLKNVEILTSEYSPYKDLKVLIHLDHIQWNDVTGLLGWDMEQFSSIMYDSSTLPLDENIMRTAAFVEKNKSKIVIEGACDEITKNAEDLASPENVEKYYNETGADIIVANLGTEHRASSAKLHYNSDLARKIRSKIGTCLCLHGSSSVSSDHISKLFEDGICKVNIWTALERDSSPVLFQSMVENSAKIVGSEKAKKMHSEGLLGDKVDLESKPSVNYFTNTYRDKIIFDKIQDIITGYLKLWYI